MTEEERAAIIKEARINAMYDMRQALAKMADQSGSESMKTLAEFLMKYIGEEMTDVMAGKAGGVRV